MTIDEEVTAEKSAAADPSKAARSAILAWAKEQPLWKQQALRWATAGVVADSKINELASLVIASVDKDSVLEVEQLTEAELGFSSGVTAPFRLAALADVKNVNRLAKGQKLEFGATGVTAIYGDNGSGKSGYARIFKLACGARDQEEVLHNVFESAPAEPSAAVFSLVDEGGAPTNIAWSIGAAVDHRLGSIATFDSRCAPFYVEKSAYLAFTPYGLDCFEHLATALDSTASVIGKEIAEIDQSCSAPLLNDFDADRVSVALDELLKLTLDELDEKLTWEAKQEEALLAVATAAKDPVGRVKSLRAASDELDVHQKALAQAAQEMTDEKVQTLLKMIGDASSLSKASAVAATELFSGEPLEGVGSAEWTHLFESAREYSCTHAYPDKSFPPHGDEDRCVLCQQPLDADARQRLIGFEAHVKGDVAQKAAQSQMAVDVLQAQYEATANTLASAILDEIARAESPKEAATLDSLKAVLVSRLAAIRSQFTDHASEIPIQPTVPNEGVNERIKALNDAAEELQKLVESGQAPLLADRLASLEIQKALCHAKDAIKARWKALARRTNLQAAKDLCGTAAVTRKGGELLKEFVTTKLAKDFASEKQALDVTSVEISMIASPEKGAVKRTLGLADQKIKAPPPRVLSEGEYRAVALAAFFAEIGTIPGGNPIVIDDPVSSLDHRRRERVARRIAKEGAKRQVIVFTHDLSFFLTLQAECPPNKSTWTSIYLERGSGGYGSVSSVSAPWGAQKFTDRKGHLHNRLVELRDHEKEHGEDERYRELITVFYDRARKAWERALEELVFQESVVRFRPSVQTLRLVSAPIDDEVYTALFEGMTRASKITGHDQAAELGGGWPSPADADDIMTSLIAFETLVKGKASSVKKLREAAGKVAAPAQDGSA